MIRTPDGVTLVPLMEMEETPLSQEEGIEIKACHEKFLKNLKWFEAHVTQIRHAHSGKSICIAGESLFTGNDPGEVVARARVAFPDEWGSFFAMYLQPQR